MYGIVPMAFYRFWGVQDRRGKSNIRLNEPVWSSGEHNLT
jgi:hypothetical protein